ARREELQFQASTVATRCTFISGTSPSTLGARRLALPVLRCSGKSSGPSHSLAQPIGRRFGRESRHVVCAMPSETPFASQVKARSVNRLSGRTFSELDRGHAP